MPKFPAVTWVTQKYQDRVVKVGEANSIKSGGTPFTAKVSTLEGQQGLDSGGKTPPIQHFEQKLSSNCRLRVANLTHTQHSDVGKNKTATAPVRRPGREHFETITACNPA